MKSKRKQIQEKLIKFATRIPVFMYLTDYRERCLKDVITQLEPGLFKKVTGLSVEDFNMLCSLGVFNAPLMNDAIFKFKRYEDASLTYTGLDKHADDEVGGWDTTIRKKEYEKLYYNQQTSISEYDESVYRSSYNRTTKTRDDVPEAKHVTASKASSSYERVATPIATTVATAPVAVAPTPSLDLAALQQRLEALEMGASVLHKKFGIGTVERLNKSEKFIYVKFSEGEKKFIFPDAFVNGFLMLP
jgi:hypothetical protein